MGRNRSKRSGHGLHVTSSDLPLDPVPSDSPGGSRRPLPLPPQSPTPTLGVGGRVTTHPEVTAGGSDLVDSRRSQEEGQPVTTSSITVTSSTVTNLIHYSASSQQPPAPQPPAQPAALQPPADLRALHYLLQAHEDTRMAPRTSHPSSLLSRPSVPPSSPPLPRVAGPEATGRQHSPFFRRYLPPTAARTRQEEGDKASALRAPADAHHRPSAPEETKNHTPLTHATTLQNPTTLQNTTTLQHSTTLQNTTTLQNSTTTSRKPTRPTTYSTRGHRRLTSRTQRSAPTQQQVVQSPAPDLDPERVCDNDPCGQEPSCHPTKADPRGFHCYCDDMTRVNPGASCSSRGEMLSEHPSPKTLTIPREPMNAVWAVGVASVLVVGVLLLIYWRRKSLCVLMRHRHREKKPGPQSPDGTAKSNALVAYNFASNPNYYTQGPDTQTVHTLPVHLIHPEQISFIGELGEGCFGKVYKGTYGPRCPESIEQRGDEEVDEDGERGAGGDDGGGGGGEDDRVSLTVAVKVIKESVGVEGEEDFMREVEIMSAFSHPNILSLIGIVAKGSGGTPWMVFEFMSCGDLAELLRSCSPHFYSNHTPATTLSKEELLHISVQIASGMEYLSSQHFVHRDLACRNCLVGENLTVKISDFGMSRDVYTCDYYKVGGSRMLPVRWMAPESVMYGKFTLESDVWSFGVVLWEIYSFGKQPYYGNSNENVVKLIFQGILLSPPDTCPPQVCDVMRRCWATDPTDRLKFPEILTHLKGLHGEGKGAPPHSTCPQSTFSFAGAPVTYSQLCMQEEAEGHLDKDLYLVPRRVEPREYLTILNDV